MFEILRCEPSIQNFTSTIFTDDTIREKLQSLYKCQMEIFKGSQKLITLPKNEILMEDKVLNSDLSTLKHKYYLSFTASCHIAHMSPIGGHHAPFQNLNFLFCFLTGHHLSGLDFSVPFIALQQFIQLITHK